MLIARMGTRKELIVKALDHGTLPGAPAATLATCACGPTPARSDAADDVVRRSSGLICALLLPKRSLQALQARSAMAARASRWERVTKLYDAPGFSASDVRHTVQATSPAWPKPPRGRSPRLAEGPAPPKPYAGTGNRTQMRLPSGDFKSPASSQFRHPGLRTQSALMRERTEEAHRLFRPFVVQNQSGKRDSNPRPQPWQGCALPTELFPQPVKNRPAHSLGQAHRAHCALPWSATGAPRASAR